MIGLKAERTDALRWRFGPIANVVGSRRHMTVGERRAGEGTRTSLPAWRIGVVSGVAGMLCCVGPTVLALLGVVSAGTAITWAYDLYDGWAWAFRLLGLGTAAGLMTLGLRRRDACTLRGVRSARRPLGIIAVAGVGTYALLYWVTTVLGERAAS